MIKKHKATVGDTEYTQKDFFEIFYSDRSTIYVTPNIEKSSIYNPYLKLLYPDFKKKVRSAELLFPLHIFKKLLQEKSIWHVHWIEVCSLKDYLITVYKIILLIAYSLAGGKIVWTLHNISPHCNKFKTTNILIRSTLVGISDKIIVHSRSARKIVIRDLKIVPEKCKIVTHPQYPISIMDKKVATNYLRRLDITFPSKYRNIFLVYGKVAPYKGILKIIELFSEINAQLIIAGATPSVAYMKKVRDACDNKNNILYINNLIDNKTEQALFSIANFILFNYQRILFSGGIVLARSYGKSIIIPDLECFDYLEESSQIIKFKNIYDLRNIISSKTGTQHAE